MPALVRSLERSTVRPCEDCGGLVVEGLEPVDPADEVGDVVVVHGLAMVGSDWCTNLDCPSNHAVRGLHRVGVNQYACKTCSESLTGPVMSILAHLRAH